MLAAQEFLFDLNPQLLFDAALLAIAVFFLYMLPVFVCPGQTLFVSLFHADVISAV